MSIPEEIRIRNFESYRTESLVNILFGLSDNEYDVEVMSLNFGDDGSDYLDIVITVRHYFK